MSTIFGNNRSNLPVGIGGTNIIQGNDGNDTLFGTLLGGDGRDLAARRAFAPVTRYPSRERVPVAKCNHAFLGHPLHISDTLYTLR